MRVLKRYAPPVIATLILVVIAGITWKPDETLVEHPLDESKLPVLPAPEDLPPVALPGFRYSHPLLPAPSAGDIARLKLENPAWLNKHKKRAADGKGDFYSAFVTAYVEPGSLNLDILYQRLMALEITWRGHKQAKPVAIAYDCRTVGTPVTRRPLHRPGRAVFPHPVPRLYSLSRKARLSTDILP
jgi:hypothetical protein